MVVLTAQILILAAVVTAAVAFVTAQKSVTVVVDGRPTHITTFDGSIGAVLSKAHVQLAEHDTVSPPLGRQVGDHGTVTVGRGRLLDLVVNNESDPRWVTATTVGDALGELGLTNPNEYVSQPLDAPLSLQGAALAVRLPQTVRVLVDGRDRELSTTAASVRDLLTDSQIPLSGLDRLSVDSDAYPESGMVVSITRVAAKQETTSRIVAAGVERVADATLYVGSTHTVARGVDGVLTSVYAVTYLNGQPADRVLTGQVMTTQPKNAVVAYGTKPRPVAPTPTLAPDGLNWAALANCESGGNPRSVSANGKYRGMYQFSLSTWHGVGGSGDPIDASPAEQTYRAQILYRSSGRSAWPICGRYL